MHEEWGTRKWVIEDGIIRLTLPASEVLSGAEWAKRLEREDYMLDHDVIDLLDSSKFVSSQCDEEAIMLVRSEGVLSMDVSAIVQQVTETIGYDVPAFDIAPRLRKYFSDSMMAELGLWWICIPREIRDSTGNENFFVIMRGKNRERSLKACWMDGATYPSGPGAFAFAE